MDCDRISSVSNFEDCTFTNSCNEPERTNYLINIPLAMEDQHFESLLALAGMHNGAQLSGNSLGAVLGKPYLWTHREFHVGFPLAYELLRTAGHESFEKFLNAHSVLPLFKPFISNESHVIATAKLKSANIAGMFSLLGNVRLTVDRQNFRYCLQCAAIEIDSFGFAYAHRTHQIRGVDFCHIHDTSLYSRNPDDDLYRKADFGVIVPEGDLEWHYLLEPIVPKCNSPAWKSLGKWVHASFTGQIPPTSERVRTRVICERIAEIERKYGDPLSIAARLEIHLSRSYSANALESLKLSICKGISSHWPAFLAFGTAYTDQPMANLLVLSSIFNSPEEFVECARILDRKFCCEEIPNSVVEYRTRRIPWENSLIRDFYRLPAQTIARKRGVNKQTIILMLRLHPDLEKRIELFRQRNKEKYFK